MPKDIVRRKTRRSTEQKTEALVPVQRYNKPIVPLQSSANLFVQSVLLLASTIDTSSVAEFLASKGHKNLANYLSNFDWQAALRLLPYLVEFADSFTNLSGAEKEKQVLALCVKIAQMANVSDMIDEDALESIRIIIATMCDIGSGKFSINAEQQIRCMSFTTRFVRWLARHQPCCRASTSSAQRVDQNNDNEPAPMSILQMRK